MSPFMNSDSFNVFNFKKKVSVSLFNYAKFECKLIIN